MPNTSGYSGLRYLMQTELLNWLIRYLYLVRIGAEWVYHRFMVMWYESEIKYLNERIAKIDRELAELERS